MIDIIGKAGIRSLSRIFHDRIMLSCHFELGSRTGTRTGRGRSGTVHDGKEITCNDLQQMRSRPGFSRHAASPSLYGAQGRSGKPGWLSMSRRPRLTPSSRLTWRSGGIFMHALRGISILLGSCSISRWMPVHGSAPAQPFSFSMRYKPARVPSPPSGIFTNRCRSCMWWRQAPCLSSPCTMPLSLSGGFSIFPSTR